MAIIWTQKTKGGSGFGGPCAIDNTGAFIIEQAANYDSYKTTNQGTNWTSCDPNSFRSAAGMSVDSDGSHIIYAYTTGANYYVGFSVDSGANWTEVQPGTGNYYCCDIDSDGSVMLLGTQYRLYKSVNSGTDWTEMRPVGDASRNWQSVCCSSDGSVIYAGNTLRLYVSSDTGANWTEVRPAGDANFNWSSTRCSADGSKVIAQISNGRTYISTNSGGAWSEVAPSGTASDNYYVVDISGDGTVMIAASKDVNGRYWVSTDTGANWAETRPIDNADYQWYPAISGDGTKLWASNNGNSAYSYYGITSTALELYSTTLFDDANLRAYYRLEDLNDATANNYDLTTGTYNALSCMFNNGQNIADTDTYYSRIDSDLGISTADDTSISLWIKQNSEISTATDTLCAFLVTNGYALSINYQYNSGAYRLLVNYAGTAKYYSVTLGTSIHNIVAIADYSTAGLKVYLDNVLVINETISSPTTTANSSAFAIGGTTSGGNYANFIIDDVSVFNRILTEDEVNYIYTGEEPAPTTNIKSWNGLAVADIKSINGLAIADVKSINGLS